MLRLTDDTGILQHASYSIPDRDHGYCVDDNARALIAACWGAALGGGEELVARVPVYLSFLQHAFNRANGCFRNFMSFDRQWLEEAGSEDSHGRSLWGLAVASASAPLSSQRALASALFRDGLAVSDRFSSPRARAFAMLGLDSYLGAYQDTGGIQATLERHAAWLHDRFACNDDPGWLWCEHSVTYANAVLPLGVLVAGCRLGDQRLVETAISALRWLLDQQMVMEGHLSIIGNDGWMTRDGHRARFDQQPIDAAALTLACAEAYRCTSDPVWIEDLYRCLAWFTGHNDLGLPLLDRETGGCCDGLQAGGVNANQGAESTLVWILARQCVERIQPGAAPGYAHHQMLHGSDRRIMQFR